MDVRRKIIRDLDERRRENLLFRIRTLEDLGKSLTERLGAEALPGNRGGDYRRFKQEIADSEASIESIQDALKRIRELDEELSIKRFEKQDRGEEAAVLYERLGRRILEGAMPGELRDYKRQYALLRTRSDSFEEQLRELEESGENGVFPWITRLIRGTVLRSSLKRNQRQIDRLYCQTGESYARSLEAAGESAVYDGKDGELAVIIRDTLTMRQNLAELDRAAAVLEQEKLKIQRSFGFKEKPVRRIRVLEELAGKRREELRELYLKIGEEAALALQENLEDGDRTALEKAQRYRESAAENGREIERLEAEIAIDREREKIARMERTVSGQKSRAADSERSITELNRKIAEANKKIEDLKIAGGIQQDTAGEP